MVRNWKRTRDRCCRVCLLFLLLSPQLEELLHYICTIRCQHTTSDGHVWVEWVDRRSWFVRVLRAISFTPFREKSASIFTGWPDKVLRNEEQRLDIISSVKRLWVMKKNIIRGYEEEHNSHTLSSCHQLREAYLELPIQQCRLLLGVSLQHT